VVTWHGMVWARSSGGEAHSVASGAGATSQRHPHEASPMAVSCGCHRPQVPRRVPQDSAAAAAQPAQSALLAVNARAVKGDDELRRIFGSRVVDAGERDDDAGAVPGMHRIP